ncbi:MAG: TetR/AcrR family transcriptional regulator [Ktedonobacterales bacterium]|nr:TetR/AcrR family transcriptional regulator [Ktedonobacterales bacterium]
MEKVKPTLTHRQRQAQATRTLIIDAARKLFLQQGYVATTIDAIGTEAGVAVSTVYAIFRNKRGILGAIREAWHQTSGQRELFQDAMEASDPCQRLALMAHATRRQWETGAEMTAIYQAAASADPEAADELATALRGRRTGLKRFIDACAPDLRQDMSAEQLLAILFALTLPQLYEELVQTSGWSPHAYEEWLTETLQRQLLAP